MTAVEPSDDLVQAVLEQLRLPTRSAAEPVTRKAAAEILAGLGRFGALLPAAERPADAPTLLEFVAGTNAFDPLRVERRLPVTIVFYSSIHPAYYEGEARIGEAPWRL